MYHGIGCMPKEQLRKQLFSFRFYWKAEWALIRLTQKVTPFAHGNDSEF